MWCFGVVLLVHNSTCGLTHVVWYTPTHTRIPHPPRTGAPDGVAGPRPPPPRPPPGAPPMGMPPPFMGGPAGMMPPPYMMGPPGDMMGDGGGGRPPWGGGRGIRPRGPMGGGTFDGPRPRGRFNDRCGGWGGKQSSGLVDVCSAVDVSSADVSSAVDVCCCGNVVNTVLASWGVVQCSSSSSCFCCEECTCACARRHVSTHIHYPPPPPHTCTTPHPAHLHTHTGPHLEGGPGKNEKRERGTQLVYDGPAHHHGGVGKHPSAHHGVFVVCGVFVMWCVCCV